MRSIFPLLFAGLCVYGQPNPNLPGMAEGILDQAKLAQHAVASSDKEGAIDHIKQGLSLADEIRQNSPDSTGPIFVQVYQQVETTSTYTPVKHKSGEMSADRMKADTSIRGVSADVTTTKLDVLAAADCLSNAQASLERGDWNGGNSALAAVATSVVTTQSQGDKPLDMARQNLELARMRVVDDRYKDAAVPLRSAAQAMGDFEKRCTGQEQQAVEFARQSVVDFADHISHHHENAAEKIDGWLASINKWSGSPGQ